MFDAQAVSDGARACANAWCTEKFSVLEEDRKLLQQFDVPEPTKCPLCRHQERGVYKGEIRLHKRTSDLTGKPVVSIFPASAPYPIYAIDEWWGDGWDDLEHGREFDFNRPFFEQFAELFTVAPKMANFNEKCENSEFSTYAGMTRNAYYCHEAYRSEDVYYCRKVTGYNEKLCDCLRCQGSSYLYECVQCDKCHYSSYLYRCTNTRDGHFCIDCQGCNDCLFSWNLRNKEYCIFNEKLSKEEYEKRKTELIDGRYSTLQQNFQRLREMYPKIIWKDLNNINTENCRGDALLNSADSYECYNCVNQNGNRYCIDMSPSEQCINCMDQTGGGISELAYSCQGLGGGNYHLRMCVLCRGTSDLDYCIFCYYCKNCFACTSLKSKQFCILNKQYTEEEYKALVPKIIEYMKSTGEWGQFFPVNMSPFSYNLSLSSRMFPLSKEDVLKRGWRWDDQEDLQPEGIELREQLPDSIDDVTDDICSKVITCEKTGQKFAIQKAELEFYRVLRQPLPRFHPLARMERRLQMLAPYHLYGHNCAKCSKDIETSFAPNRPETVYCEECYLAAVY